MILTSDHSPKRQKIQKTNWFLYHSSVLVTFWLIRSNSFKYIEIRTWTAKILIQSRNKVNNRDQRTTPLPSSLYYFNVYFIILLIHDMYDWYRYKSWVKTNIRSLNGTWQFQNWLEMFFVSVNFCVCVCTNATLIHFPLPPFQKLDRDDFVKITKVMLFICEILFGFFCHLEWKQFR